MKKSIYSNNYKHLLDLLITSRKNCGFTQKQLGDKLQYSQSIISKIETGDRRIDIIEFIEISNAIGRNPFMFLDDFLSEWED